MARIKSEGKGVERFDNESNDCTVRALANAVAIPYPLAHRLLAKAGRKTGRGLSVRDWYPVYKRFGIELQSIHGSSRGARFLANYFCQQQREGITLERLLPRLQNGRYVVHVSGHVFAVVDGKVLDYGDNPAGCRVIAVYKAAPAAVVFDKPN